MLAFPQILPPPLPENIILFAGLGGGVVFYSFPALARPGTNLMNHLQGVSIQLKAEPRKRYRSQLRTAGMPPGVPRAGPSLRTRVCAYLSTVSMYPTKIIQQIFCSPISSFHVYRTHKFAGFTQPKTSLEFDMQNHCCPVNMLVNSSKRNGNKALGQFDRFWT